MNDLATLSPLAGNAVIATLTLNRPEARNALSLDLLGALHARLDDLAAAAHTPTVLVITGAGKAFCAGMDLKAVLDNHDLALRLLLSLADLTLRIRRLPCVTLAQVNGAAIGGGCGIATVCDLAITHADSKMGFPEVDMGVCPAVVAPWLLRKIGPGPARAILLRGGLLSGREAHARGIVNFCTDSRDQLDNETLAIAARLAQGGPAALRATKDLLNQLDGSLDAESVRQGAALSAQVLATPEALAALRAKMSA